MNYEYRFNEETYSVSLDKSENGYTLTVGDRSLPLSVERIDDNTFLMTSAGRRRIVHAARASGRIFIHIDGRVHVFEEARTDEESGGAAAGEIVDGVQRVVAPMPGKLVKVTVSEGQKVSKGTTICIVEAMKMENVVQARLDGIARNIAFAAGDLVDTNSTILEIVSSE